MPSSPSARPGPASSTSDPAPAAARTELLIVDTSGSMNGKKLRSAKAATAAAVDCIPDGVGFGIITGNHEAELAYPVWGSARPCPQHETRAEAKPAVKKFEAGGGTAIGSWIELAARRPGADGGNPSRHPSHRRPERERGARGARRSPPSGRRRLPVRLPRRGRRLGGGGAAQGGDGAARDVRHRRRP